MIGKDERLTLRGNGPRELRFLETAAETAGRCLTMEAIYPARTSYPPEHFHPEQEERFAILDGALTVRLDGVSRRYGVGESFVVPRGVAHTMHNAEPGETRVRWEIRPALRSADFFAALAAERPDAGTFERLTRLAAIMDAHRREIVLSKPPVMVQRPLFRLFARIGAGMTRTRGPR